MFSNRDRCYNFLEDFVQSIATYSSKARFSSKNSRFCWKEELDTILMELFAQTPKSKFPKIAKMFAITLDTLASRLSKIIRHLQVMQRSIKCSVKLPPPPSCTLLVQRNQMTLI